MLTLFEIHLQDINACVSKIESLFLGTSFSLNKKLGPGNGVFEEPSEESKSEDDHESPRRSEHEQDQSPRESAVQE